MLWKIGLLCLASLAAAQWNGTRNGSCVALDALSPRCRFTEVAYHREFFYIGGRYVNSTGPPAGSVLVDQMYVEKLSPALGPRQPRPLVFFHGGGTSGVVGQPLSGG